MSVGIWALAMVDFDPVHQRPRASFFGVDLACKVDIQSTFSGLNGRSGTRRRDLREEIKSGQNVYTGRVAWEQLTNIGD